MMAINSPEPVSEQSELIKRARKGDKDAFGKIVNLYRRMVIGYCHRMVGAEAEDAAQEIFIKLYLAIDRFDISKPVAPFLFRISHNHCLDILKKKGVRTISLETDTMYEKVSRHQDKMPDPEETIQKAELREEVNRALAAIPPLYRSPLIMWHVDGISYEEISQILELPIGTVKARIHRGRKILQQKLMRFVIADGEQR
jgi:RNA polymerase sigma-70 factor (ECF subfamily)